MDIPASLIPTSWLLPGWLLYLVASVVVLLRAPWFRLLQKDSSNVYFGAIVVLLGIWNLNAGVIPGQSIHLIGASAISLMFGWELAFLAIQLLIVVFIFSGRTEWQGLALNALLLGALPALSTHSLLLLSRRWLPHNYFVYFFINTFLATILGILLVAAVISLLLQPFASHLTQGILPFILMLALPEAILTGMLISILIVYKPAWITTFRDEVYLKKKE